MPGHDISEEYEYEWKWNGATEERMKTLMLGYHIRTEMRLTHVLYSSIQCYTQKNKNTKYLYRNTYTFTFILSGYFSEAKKKKKKFGSTAQPPE